MTISNKGNAILVAPLPLNMHGGPMESLGCMVYVWIVIIEALTHYAGQDPESENAPNQHQTMS